jgi:excinuclease ABC subunit C
MDPSIQKQLENLPHEPGVYLFRDNTEKVIYVGKAIDLFNRVSSYFMSTETQTAKTQQLVEHVHKIDFILSHSEDQALILENNLIKRYRPKYNIRLRDDKTYPYIKIDLANEWPRVYVTRRIEDDGSKYFGPFTNSGSVRKVLGLIEKIYKLKSCKTSINSKINRSCLNYHIGRCVGPCIKAIDKKTYMQMIRQIIMLIEGKEDKIVQNLKNQMEHFSDNFLFEQAAIVRDQISALENVISGQKIGLIIRGDKDVIAISQKGDLANAYVFMIRNNRLIGRSSFIIEGTQYESNSQIVTDFIKQYYSLTTNIPPEILLPNTIDEVSAITNWLKLAKGKPVKLVVPHRGTKKELMKIVADNARIEVERAFMKEETGSNIENTLSALQTTLNLKTYPERIEGYDISNIKGNFAVGSMVVFLNGKPDKESYRSFKIRHVEGIDDYAMIREVLKRRFTNYQDQRDSWKIKPDLVLIDGGKGHLNSAMEALRDTKTEDIQILSLAKQNEEIFLPGRDSPLTLPITSSELQLLQRVRDEAHRFALRHHKISRSKRALSSPLNDIPGIGPKRKKALLLAFGSLNGIKAANIEELQKISGITKNQAYLIKQNIQN